MSDITLNSLGSGEGNLVITFTDSVPDNTIEYVVFILDSSNNIVASETFTLEEAEVAQNDNGSATLVWNYLNLVNGNTYSVQIGKNKDSDLVMQTLDQMSQKVYNLPNAPVAVVDHSGCKLTVNWDKVTNNGSIVTEYNIYSAELNSTNLVLDGDWYLSKMDTSGTNIYVPYNPEAEDLYVKIGSEYVKSIFGNLRKFTTVDYIIESTAVGNYILVTPYGLTDQLGNPISDISGNLYDADGVAILDFSGNMISIEDDRSYVISAEGSQVLADRDQVAIKYPDGQYKYVSPNVFEEQRYGLYNKIENISYVQAHNDGVRIMNYERDNPEPVLNLLCLDTSDNEGIVSKLGKLFDLSGNVVYDLSGNHVDAVNNSIKCDMNGLPILTLVKSASSVNGISYPDLISNYNGLPQKLGYQIIKHQSDPEVGFLVTAVNSAGETPTISNSPGLGGVNMPYADSCSAYRGQIVYTSPDAPSSLSVQMTNVDGSGIVMKWTVPKSNGQLLDGYLIVLSDLDGNSSYGTFDRSTYDFDPKLVASITKNTGTEVSLTMPFDNTDSPALGSLQSFFNPNNILAGSGISSGLISEISFDNIKNYSFKLIAVNQNVNVNNDWAYYENNSFRDISNFSNSASITPTVIPNQVASAVAVPSDSSKLTITITDTNQNASTQPILGYIITYIKNGQSQIISSTGTTKEIAGLTNGTTYTFKIFARNAKGISALECTCSGTPTGSPTSPTLSVDGHDAGQIELSWTVPENNGGSDIMSYRVYRSDTGEDDSWNLIHDTSDGSVYYYSDTTVTLSQTYYYYVVATNAIGDGDSSNIVNEYASTTPGSPSLDIVSGSVVTLNIGAPNDNGGAPLLSYNVYRGIAGYVDDFTGLFIENIPNVDISGNPLTILAENVPLDLLGNAVYTDTNVTFGTAYYYKVAAVNRDGVGSRNTTANTDGEYIITTGNKSPYIVPCEVPDSVTTLNATTRYNNTTAAVSEINLQWTIPDNGGAPVTSYVLQATTTPYTGSSWKTYVRYDPSGNPASPATNNVIAGAGNPLLTDGSGNFINGNVTSGLNSLAYGTLYNADGSGNVQNLIPDASGNLLFKISSVPTSNYQNLYDVQNNLSMGQEYAFRVVATNAVGSSAVSNVATVTPSRQTSEVTSLSSVAGDKSVPVSWQPPLNDGGSDILSYFIYDVGGQILGNVSGNTLTYNVTHDYSGNALVNETPYTFNVKALNKNGFGAVVGPNATTATPYATPTIPLNLSYSSQTGQVIVEWSPPANASDLPNPFNYVYNLKDGSNNVVSDETVSSTTTSKTFTGLTDLATYTFTIYATGSNSTVGPSATLDVIPSSLATQLWLTLESSGANNYTARWSAPTSDGGSPIVSYLLVWYDSNGGTYSHQTLDGITYSYNFQNNYTVTIVAFALNANGASPMSNVALLSV